MGAATLIKDQLETKALAGATDVELTQAAVLLRSIISQVRPELEDTERQLAAIVDELERRQKSAAAATGG